MENRTDAERQEAGQPAPCDVSVIVPIYNMERFVESGVASLRAQEGVATEAIFVDDGSTDRSAERLRGAIEGCERFRLIRTENRGSGPARNTGMQAAVGEYLYFFDIDDQLEPGALRRMVEALREAQADLLVFGYTIRHSDVETPRVVPVRTLTVDGADARLHYDRYMEGDACIQGAPWNKLFRRDVALQNGVEYPALRRNQDEVFLMRYMAHARSVRIISDVLYRHLANTQERMWLKYRLDYNENVEQLFDFFDEYIIAWNPDNDAALRLVQRLYYRCALDAMKVLFNPKWKLSHRARYGRLKAQLADYQARARRYATEPVDAKVAQSNFYPLIRGNRRLALYLALYARTASRRIAKG